MSKKIIRVLICEPGKEPYIKRITKSREAIEKILGENAKVMPNFEFNVWHTMEKEIKKVSDIFKKSKSQKFLITGYGNNDFLCSVDSFVVNCLNKLFNDEDALIIAELKADNRAANETYISARRFERRVYSKLKEYSSNDIENIYKKSNVDLLKEIYYLIHKAFEEGYKVKDTKDLTELTYFVYPVIAESKEGKLCLGMTSISQWRDWEPEDVYFLYSYGMSINNANQTRMYISIEDMKDCNFYTIDEDMQSKIKSDNNPSDIAKEMIEYVKEKLKGEEVNEADVSN